MLVTCLKSVHDGRTLHLPGAVIEMDASEASRLAGWVEVAAVGAKPTATKAELPAATPELGVGLEVVDASVKIGKR